MRKRSLICGPGASTLALVFFALIMSLSVLFGGCKKEKDEGFPEVVFLSPSPGANYFLPDTVYATVKVTDNVQLTFVRISVTRGDGVPVSNVFLQQEFAGNEATLTAYLVCDNVHLETGPYYVQVTASDGINVREAFREIQLVEVPKQLKTTLLFRSSSGQTFVDSLGVGGQSHLIANLGHAMTLGAAGSYHAEALVMGTGTSGISILTAENWSTYGNVPVQTAEVSQYFRDVTFYAPAKKYYVASFDGRIRHFGRKGSAYGEYFVGAGFVPECLRIFGDRVYIFAHNASAGIRAVFVIHRTTGVLIQSAQVQWNIRGFFPYGSNELLLFGHNAGQWRALRMELEFLNINELGSHLTPGILRETLHMGGNRYAIRTEDAVYVLNGFQNEPVQLGISGSPKRIRFNDVSSRLLVLAGNQLITADVNGNIVQTVAIGSNPDDFDLLFNK